MPQNTVIEMHRLKPLHNMDMAMQRHQMVDPTVDQTGRPRPQDGVLRNREELLVATHRPGALVSLMRNCLVKGMIHSSEEQGPAQIHSPVRNKRMK
jgi:hypothetical protein